jgi:F0F1-type ATP synthase assembly protein I
VETDREGTTLAGPGGPAQGFLRHRGLIALAVGGALVEAWLLTIFAPAARPLAPQITALPPLAVFHDLRWLFGYNRSLWSFELAYGGLVLARATMSTFLIRLAWPRQLPAPTWAATFGRCVIFTVVATVLLSPVVTLLFGVSLLPFSWPYLAALPALLLILVPLSHGGLRGSWWRMLPPPRAVC